MTGTHGVKRLRLRPPVVTESPKYFTLKKNPRWSATPGFPKELPFVGLTQRSESVRIECSAIVYSVRIGPPQPISLIRKGLLVHLGRLLLRLGKGISFPVLFSGQPVPNSSPSFSAAARSSCVKVCV